MPLRRINKNCVTDIAPTSQKTYIVDILEKKREANKGQVPKYYVEDSHEAIIPKDIFRRIKWNNQGCKSTVWRCISRVEKIVLIAQQELFTKNYSMR